jgi:beta-lactamase superfamily II metal-dependent hydrolase
MNPRSTVGRPITDEDLVIHVLNVGFGDTTIIEFPAEPDADNEASMIRSYGLVDCRDAGKTREYLLALAERRASTTQLRFLCATHPHADHISGIRAMILDECFTPHEFWDSGFRHSSQSYRGILMALKERQVPLSRVSSGMEQHFGTVQVTALAPSATLRNSCGSYAVRINNASIVLRLENRASMHGVIPSPPDPGDIDPERIHEVGKSTMILGGDAELESWAQIAKEYAQVDRASDQPDQPDQPPLVRRMINLLACRALKVAHHGSMQSSALDIYERMRPALAIISTKQERKVKLGLPAPRRLFPHPAAQRALEEIGAKLLMTDADVERQHLDRKQQHDPENAREGSVIVVIPPGGAARWRKLGDREHQVPEVVDVV